VGRARLLADPWTVGAGLFVGALATAGLGLPVALGVAAAAGSYAVGTLVKAVSGRPDAGPPPPAQVVLPPPGTDARILYERARSAVGDLADIAAAQDPGPLREQAATVADQARDTVDGIARIAGQTVVLRQALARVDVAQAQRDLQRLQQTTGSGREESLAAVRSQLAVAERLEAVWREAHDRLLSSALGLESLVASLAEVVAMSSGTGGVDAGGRIRSLSDSLAGLRAGVAEAEEASRRALSA